MAMTSISRREYLNEVQKQYQGACKSQKSDLLTAAPAVTGLHRKSIIRSLRAPMRHSAKQAVWGVGKRGPKVAYDTAFHEALLVCWHAENDICAERLQPFLPDLVPKLESLSELKLNPDTRQRLLKASIATVARHLGKAQRRSTIPLSTTKPGSLLKTQIAVRKGRWQETNPGWLESDTVAHCGDYSTGQFINSYNFVDIATGWVEMEATMGKGGRATVASFDHIRDRLPFATLGIDSDNGAEYINAHLYRYCLRESLNFTRSRSYQKNDNAHVEQKNWEAIRKIVGYHRLDTEEQLDILNGLYRSPLRLYLNYFQPTRKRRLKLVDTATGQKKKFYFVAKTPYQRVMQHCCVPETTKELLQSEYNQLNPVKLLAEIRTLIGRLNRTLR
jgi:hypothetical protein